MKPELLMLAHNHTDDIDITNWWASEKLDGQRCFWDGGFTIGMYMHRVPWHNKMSSRLGCKSTGFWSRLGNVINAPKYWQDHMPQGVPLDGELYGDMSRQELRSIISRHKPITLGWNGVSYHVFDIPNRSFLSSRVITGPRVHIEIGLETIKYEHHFPKGYTIEEVQPILDGISFSSFIRQVGQVKMPNNHHMRTYLTNLLTGGAEGLMLRAPGSVWEPYRSKQLLKVKCPKEGHGIVIGYKAGKDRLLGLMGSLTVEWDGKQFDISGFTDEERKLIVRYTSSIKGIEDAYLEANRWCVDKPGQKIDNSYMNHPIFPIGSEIEFKYNRTTDDGIPIEARYSR